MKWKGFHSRKIISIQFLNLTNNFVWVSAFVSSVYFFGFIRSSNIYIQSKFIIHAMWIIYIVILYCTSVILRYNNSEKVKCISELVFRSFKKMFFPNFKWKFLTLILFPVYYIFENVIVFIFIILMKFDTAYWKIFFFSFSSEVASFDATSWPPAICFHSSGH